MWTLGYPAMRWDESRLSVGCMPTGSLPLARKVLFAAPAGALAAVRWSLIWSNLGGHADESAVLVVYASSTLVELLACQLVARASDATRSRLGRRKPFMAVGVLLSLLVAVFEITSPGWFGLPVVFFSLHATLFEVAHGALATEMTPVGSERSSLLALCEGASTIGFFVGGVVPLLAELGGAGSYDRTLGLPILCALLLIATTLLLWLVPERSAQLLHEESPRGSVAGGLVGLSLNRAFYPLVLAEACESLALAGAVAWLCTWLLAPDAHAQPGALAEPSMGTAGLCAFGAGMVAGVPLWRIAGSRLGDYQAALLRKLSTALGLVLVAVSLMSGSGLTALCVASSLTGLSFSGTFLTRCLSASAADYDFLLTGQRREGIYHATLWLVPRLTLTLALVALAWLGSENGAHTIWMEHNETAALDIVDRGSYYILRIAGALSLAALALLSVVALSKCPVKTSAAQSAIVASSVWRHANGADSITDPLFGFTHATIPHFTPAQGRAHSLLSEFWPAEIAFAAERGSVCVLYVLPAATALLASLLLGVCVPPVVRNGDAEHCGAALIGSGLCACGLCLSLSRLCAVWRLRREGLAPSGDVLVEQLEDLGKFTRGAPPAPVMGQSGNGRTRHPRGRSPLRASAPVITAVP